MREPQIETLQGIKPFDLVRDFHQAIKQKDINKIKSHLIANKDLFYSKDQNGDLAINSIIDSKDINLFNSAMIHPEYFEFQDGNKNSLAHIALKRNSIEIFKALIAKNHNYLVTPDDNNETPLLLILKQENLELLNLIAINYPDFLFKANQSGISIFHQALQEGNTSFFNKIFTNCPWLITMDENLIRKIDFNFFKTAMSEITSDELSATLNFKIENSRRMLNSFFSQNRADLLEIIIKKCPNILENFDDISVLSRALEIKFLGGDFYPKYAIDTFAKTKFDLVPDDYNTNLMKVFCDTANILLLNRSKYDYPTGSSTIISSYNGSPKIKETLSKQNVFPDILFSLGGQLKINKMIELPNNNFIYVTESDIVSHSSYYVFNINQNQQITSLTYCDGHKLYEGQSIDKHSELINCATTFHFKNPIDNFQNFIKDFLSLNAESYNLYNFYKRKILFPCDVEIERTDFSVPSKMQNRGNCVSKSIHILSQFINNQLNIKTDALELSGQYQVNPEGKKMFKEYKNSLIEINLKKLQTLHDYLDSKEQKNKLDHFILANSKKVLEKYYEYQEIKDRRQRDIKSNKDKIMSFGNSEPTNTCGRIAIENLINKEVKETDEHSLVRPASIPTAQNYQSLGPEAGISPK